MPSQSLRLLAAASVLALGAGTVSAPSATASATPSTGVLAAVQRAAAPVVSASTTWRDARRAAEAALARAQAQLRADDRRAPTTRRTDLTLVLRDLRVGLPYLDAQDRRAAQRIFARPTDGANDPNGNGYSAKPARRVCSTHVCVRWVESTADAVPLADGDSNGYPDQVDLTLAKLTHIWDRIVTQGGYRAPLPDNGRGGDDRLDIYLADIGDEGLFGYCAPEQSGPGRSATGYCVLDNDFSPSQFGSSQTPTANLEVTAAHEFFHAVQFAYDVAEDDWFMEGTAMWMEDQLYDDVNDNVRYLSGSQLTAPTRPVDQPAPGQGGPYVSWIFWRYVTEMFPDEGSTGLPLIMKDTWRRAQAYTAAAPRTYSMRALNRAIAARGTSLAAVFARFGEANRHPDDAYSEGAEQGYPVVPLVADYTLTGSRRTVSEKVATMAHMTNFSVAFRVGTDLTAAGWKIRIPINMPAYARGSRAQLSVVKADGSRARKFVSLDRYGNGVVTAPFRRSEVRRVELTLTNAGQRYSCNQGTYLACQGTSRDNGLKSYFKATISR